MPFFTIRIFKSWGARDPERRWTNNYEITSPVASPGALLSEVNTLVAAEKKIHLPQTEFLSATVSTYMAEGPAYDPSSFLTVELQGQGERDIGGIFPDLALDSNVCLLMKFPAALGRSGKRFYRGVLSEGDVKMGGNGVFTFSGAPNKVAPGGADILAFKTQLVDMLAGGASPSKLVLISPAIPAGLSRPVVDVLSGSVVINRRNHRYFDRGPVG